MPPLLAPAILGIASAVGAGGLIGATAASAIAYGIVAIGSIGAQFAFNRLTAKRRQKGDPQLTSFTIKQSIPVRVRAYGTVKLAGALFYEDAIPLQFQPLIVGIIFCEGPITSIPNFYLNDSITNVTDAGGANLALPWATNILIEAHLGTPTQAVSSILAVQRGYSTQRLRGLCYGVMMCNQMPRPDKYFQYYYPNGVPTLRAVINSSKLFDPRDGSQSWDNQSSWKFSKNPALIIMDYLTYGLTDSTGRFIPRGMGLPKGRLNINSFAAFADLCDEVVASAYTVNPADGSITNTPRNEARYECNGSYQMDEQPADVLNKLLATCDGTLYTLADGSVGIRGGIWEAPTVIINDDMILSCELSQDTGKLEKFNHLKISFTATNLDYQVVEGVPWEDFEDEDENGVLTEELSLPYVQSHSQARRLAKIAMAKGNPEWHYTSLLCTFAAMNTLGEEFVHVTHTMPGIDQPFLVLGHKISIENKTVELQLASIDAAAYAWNAALDDAPPPSPQGLGTSIGYDPGALGGGGGGETPADRVAAAAQSLAPVGQIAAIAVGAGGTRSATVAQTLGGLGQSVDAFGPTTRTAAASQTLGGIGQSVHIVHGTPTTWNPSDKDASYTLSNGNLTAEASAAADNLVRATISKVTGSESGYFETVFATTSGGLFAVAVGLSNSSESVSGRYVGQTTNSIGYAASGVIYWGGAVLASVATYGVSDNIGTELLVDGTLKFYKNGTLIYHTTPGVPGGNFPTLDIWPGYSCTANFGASALSYLPSGATPWNG